METQTSTPNNVQLRIRGMVCDRCIDAVRTELSQLGFTLTDVRLGQVTVRCPIGDDDLKTINQVLTTEGFSLIGEQPLTTHQRTKTFINALFEQDDLSESKTRFSSLLQNALELDYETISREFAHTEGITLEKYIISRRIEKVKESLVYSDETLTEIAHRTGYSSVQHLSNQFRQQTGLTPSYFRQLRQQKHELQKGTNQLS